MPVGTLKETLDIRQGRIFFWGSQANSLAWLPFPLITISINLPGTDIQLTSSSFSGSPLGLFLKKTNIQLNYQNGSGARRYCKPSCLDWITWRNVLPGIWSVAERPSLCRQLPNSPPPSCKLVYYGEGGGGQGGLRKMVSMIHIMCLAAEGIENISLEHNQGTKLFSISSLIMLDLNITL